MKRIERCNWLVPWLALGLAAMLAAACGDDDASTATDAGGGTQDTGGPADTGHPTDTGTPVDAGEDGGTAADAGDDAGTALPTPDEIDQASATVVGEGVTQSAIAFLAAFGEASAQFGEIEILNPPPAPFEIPECPHVVRGTEPLNPDISLIYEHKDGAKYVPACTTGNGVLANGTINVSRAGAPGSRYTLLKFIKHERGSRERHPIINGCVKVEKTGTKTYTASVMPACDLSLQEKNVPLTITFGNVTWTATLENPLTVTIDDANAKLLLAAMVLKVAHDSTTRTVTLPAQATDGTDARALQFPHPVKGTTCPQAGTVEVTGKYFKRDDEALVLEYMKGDGDRGVIGRIGYILDAKTPDRIVYLDAAGAIGTHDLLDIEGFCLPDNARKYSCLTPASEGACKSIAGVYHMTAGQGAQTYQPASGVTDAYWTELLGILGGSLGALPFDVCSAIVGGEAQLVRDLAIRMEVAGNCAVSLTFGFPSYGTTPHAACGAITPDMNAKTFDLTVGDGEHKLADVFGTEVKGTIGQGSLQMTVTYQLSGTSGPAACYSDAHLGSTNGPIARAKTARERCLDNPLPPQSVWASSDDKAIWNTLDQWGAKTTVFNTSCKTFTDELGKDITYYDDTLQRNPDGTVKRGTDGKPLVSNTGTNLDFTVLGKAKSIPEAYGRDLMGLIADPVDATGAASMWSPALPAGAGLDVKARQIVLNATKQACADAKTCYPAPPPPDGPSWVPDGPTLTPEETADQVGRTFVFVAGRVKVKYPTYGMMVEACQSYTDGCTLALAAMSVICGTNQDCKDDTQKVCGWIQGFCTSLGGLGDPVGGVALPAGWTNDVSMPGGSASDLLNQDKVKVSAIGQMLRDFSSLDAYKSAPGEAFRDFAYAMIELEDADGGPGNVSVSWGGKTINLDPVSKTLDGYDVLDKTALMDYLATKNQRLYYANSKADGTNVFAYDPAATYTFGVSGFDYPPPAVMTDFPSVASIPAVPELGMCLPPPMILDNIYFPTLRWNPLVNLDGDLFKSILNGNGDQVDWSKLKPETVKGVLAKAGEAAKKMVGIYVGAYDRNDEKFDPTLARPVASKFWDSALRHGMRVFPDVGFFAMRPEAWWQVAPSGRDYMHGYNQEILNYILDIVLVRANHKILQAPELYPNGYSPALARDVGVLITMDIEWQPTFVINSDILPGGNYTHFWRRDLVGLLAPGACK